MLDKEIYIILFIITIMIFVLHLKIDKIDKIENICKQQTTEIIGE